MSASILSAFFGPSRTTAKARSVKLNLEALEDRMVLSTATLSAGLIHEVSSDAQVLAHQGEVLLHNPGISNTSRLMAYNDFVQLNADGTRQSVSGIFADFTKLATDFLHSPQLNSTLAHSTAWVTDMRTLTTDQQVVNVDIQNETQLAARHAQINQAPANANFAQTFSTGQGAAVVSAITQNGSSSMAANLPANLYGIPTTYLISLNYAGQAYSANQTIESLANLPQW